MLDFLQPLLSLLIGLALSVLGLNQSFRLYPEPTAWQQFLMALSPAGAVLLFSLCVVMVLLGVAMLVLGARGLRRRLNQIRSARWNDDERRYRDSAEWA